MFLLHGGDSDLASERARRLAPALVDDLADPFQVLRLTAETLTADPGRLAEEPATARGEIAKLLMYAKSAGALEAADIDALAAGGGPSPADLLVDLALAGDLKGLERAAAHGLADPSDAQLAAMRLAARVA